MLSIAKIIKMDNKAAFFDFHRGNDLENSAPEDAVVTDFTLVSSCVLADESEEAKIRKIKAEQVREFLSTEKKRPSSIKQKMLNFFSLK